MTFTVDYVVARTVPGVWVDLLVGPPYQGWLRIQRDLFLWMREDALPGGGPGQSADTTSREAMGSWEWQSGDIFLLETR